MSSFAEIGVLSEEQLHDVAVLSQAMRMDIASVQYEDMSAAGGLNMVMRRMRLKLSDGTEQTFVVKSVGEGNMERSRTLGLAREALFYNAMHATFAEFLPKLKYAAGDMSTGGKILILEDLYPAVQSGYYFGPCSPHNWGKDLKVLTAPIDTDMLAVATEAFRIAAVTHATNWKSPSLTQSWLRGSTWRSKPGPGEADPGREEWTTGQSYAAAQWEAAKAKETSVKWTDYMLQLMDKSFSMVDYDTFQSQMSTRAFTLVHGDYHPANMMVRKGGDKISLVLLDWEVVGVGNGAQDIAQYVISHMSPEDRRQHETQLLQEYHRTLLQHGVKDYSYDECYRDYVEGGCARWLWLLGIMAPGLPDNLMQFFHDQVNAFCQDHHVTLENVTMPRL